MNIIDMFSLLFKKIYLNKKLALIFNDDDDDVNNNIDSKILYLENLNYIKLNNLPLNLKLLDTYYINCNISPNIIFLICNSCDVYNLPMKLKILVLLTGVIPKELTNNTFNKYYTILLFCKVYKFKFSNWQSILNNFNIIK